jgi:L-alanine-DL-glutamate epimerase-like enolase superfamily enzyme
MDELVRLLPNGCCTRAGIDIALHDLCGKLAGLPLYRWFGLSPDKVPLTSYTIGIDTIPRMLEKVHEVRHFPILKVKVGVAGDVDAVKAIRNETQAILRVDANGGWSVDEAIDRIKQLEAYDIELVEQPIPPGNHEGLRTIREHTRIPIFADEDARTANDLPPLAGCVDGVNIKLMECGGLREATRMIHIAHGLGMRVMLGCMVETSLSLTAAAHLSPMVEYADLDSGLLLADDPFVGLVVHEGRIVLPEGPGLGITTR